jgi:hypothetical protein
MHHRIVGAGGGGFDECSIIDGHVGGTSLINVSKESTMSKQEIYEELVRLFNEFQTAHNSKFKKDAASARKAASAIKKLVTPYNQASIAEGKAK